MGLADGAQRFGVVSRRLRAVVRGRNDTRVRATWRVLLAMPVFWLLAGAVFAGNLQASVDAIPSGGEPLGGLAFSILHGGFVVSALVGWARYFDRRPLASYGVSASWSWLRDLLLGLGAILVTFCLWWGLASAQGWASVEVSMSAPQRPVWIGLGLFVVALGIHVAIQQVVFFRIVVENAAEGLHSRGLTARRAVHAGVVLAVPIFVVIHQVHLGLRLLDLVVVGLIFGLLYAHTGEVAFGIGLHLGVYVAGQAVFVPAADAAETVSVFQASQTMPGSLDVLAGYGFPKMMVAYGMIVAYLAWRHSGVPLEARIARCREL